MARPQITIKLSLDEQKSLTALAKKFRCFTDDGTPSVRPLMRQIANGFLVVAYPGAGGAKPPAEKPAESREFKFHKNSPPKWWLQKEITIDEFRQKTGATQAQIESFGFEVVGQVVRPPHGWGKWGGVPEWWTEDPVDGGMPLAAALKAFGKPLKAILDDGYAVHENETGDKFLIKA